MQRLKPPSDEGGGKNRKIFDGGRDKTAFRSGMVSSNIFSPSVCFADSSLVRGSLLHRTLVFPV